MILFAVVASVTYSILVYLSFASLSRFGKYVCNLFFSFSHSPLMRWTSFIKDLQKRKKKSDLNKIKCWSYLISSFATHSYLQIISIELVHPRVWRNIMQIEISLRVAVSLHRASPPQSESRTIGENLTLLRGPREAIKRTTRQNAAQQEGCTVLG